MRRCVQTKSHAAKTTLLRLVLGPDKTPFVDVLGRAQGRGVYVSPDRAVFLEALSPKGLGRAFKGMAKPLSEEAIAALVQDTERRLEARILELISLARRAGAVEIGMDPAVRATQEDRENTLIVLAKDLSERSDRSFLEQALGAAAPASLPASEARSGQSPRGNESPEGIRIVRVSEKARIGAQLGRDEVGIVAIRPSVFQGRIEDEAVRLGALTSSTNAVDRGRVPARRERARDND